MHVVERLTHREASTCVRARLPPTAAGWRHQAASALDPLAAEAGGAAVMDGLPQALDALALKAGAVAGGAGTGTGRGAGRTPAEAAAIWHDLADCACDVAAAVGHAVGCPAADEAAVCAASRLLIKHGAPAALSKALRTAESAARTSGGGPDPGTRAALATAALETLSLALLAPWPGRWRQGDAGQAGGGSASWPPALGDLARAAAQSGLWPAGVALFQVGGGVQHALGIRPPTPVPLSPAVGCLSGMFACTQGTKVPELSRSCALLLLLQGLPATFKYRTGARGGAASSAGPAAAGPPPRQCEGGAPGAKESDGGSTRALAHREHAGGGRAACMHACMGV